MTKYKTLDNGATYKANKANGVYHLHSEGVSSRRNSWITLSQIGIEYPEFIDKIADVLYYPKYNEKSKQYARSILTWLELWKFVSWKQFDSIFRICASYNEFKTSDGIFRYNGVTSINKNSVSFTTKSAISNTEWTDRATDRLHEHIFGFRPIFEEEIEDGMSLEYRSDGSRYFALPTGDERIEDFMHFGINFKGLRI
jgi:hypothetical protein